MSLIINKIFTSTGVASAAIFAAREAMIAAPAASAICATIAAAAAGAFVLYNRCDRKWPPLVERFSLKTLPPEFEQNEEEWKKETGLTPQECHQIDAYVKAHSKEWKNSRPRRISKEKSGLPRTLIIFHEDRQLYVQVCCKTKGGLGRIGCGGYKSVKRAVEWFSKSLWGQYQGGDEHHLRYHRRLDGMEGISPAPRGWMEFKNRKHYRTSTFFAPLRDGDLYSRQFNDCRAAELYTDFNEKHCETLTHQMFKILLSLETKGIVHDDLHERNILCYFINGNVKIEVIDFDYARFRNEPQTKIGRCVGRD